MRTIALLAAVLAALGLAGAAHAGCIATVGLTSLPDGVASGGTWSLDLDVLQHGRTPLADARPVVILTDEATGEQRRFAAAPTQRTGRYHADVVFPHAGSWAVSVNDGFPIAECAQTHTFGSFGIGVAQPPTSTPPAERATAVAPPPASGSFPYWALALGAAALALAAAASIMRLARARPRSPRAPLADR
jgi:YtkA-like protein